MHFYNGYVLQIFVDFFFNIISYEPIFKHWLINLYGCSKNLQIKNYVCYNSLRK